MNITESESNNRLKKVQSLSQAPADDPGEQRSIRVDTIPNGITLTLP